MKKKRGNRAKKNSTGPGKKGSQQSTTKVPTLKIKLGKRKQASSVCNVKIPDFFSSLILDLM